MNVIYFDIIKENVMQRYVETIDELVDLIDREYWGRNVKCPICGSMIGIVNIPDLELGLPELKFTQFKVPGVYCTEGHVLILLSEDKDEKQSSNIRGGL